MHDPRDRIDIAGLASPAPAPRAAGQGAPAPGSPARPWLGVWFKCCHVYGRMYRDDAGVRYRGRCPRCGAEVGARVGPGGTSRRFFEAE